jgi:hypothetical protein
LNLKPQGEYYHERKETTHSKHHFNPWTIGNGKIICIVRISGKEDVFTCISNNA